MKKRIVVVSIVASVFAGSAICSGGAAPPEAAGCVPLSLAPLSLPPGPEGVPYSYKIPTYGGQQPVKLTFASGAFPPGLAMSPTGEITGIPKASGTFDFTVTATDSCPTGMQKVSRALKLVVGGSGAQQLQPSVIRHQRLQLKLTVTPAAVSLRSGRPAEQEVAYGIEAQPPITASLNSPGGTFSVAGSVVASVPAPLTMTVINGTARVSEKIVVPAGVLEMARHEKAKITYSRPFSGRQSTALAVVEFTLDR